jgi:hypothetical protein
MTGRKEPVCYKGVIYKSFTDACNQLKIPYRTFINIRYKNPMLSVEEMLNMALKVVKTKRKYKSPATGKMVTSIAVLAKENNVPYYQLYMMISRGTAPAEAVRRLKQNKETKSVRMTLLFRPSIQESLKRIAEKENTSINSLVCAAVESFIEREEKC